MNPFHPWFFLTPFSATNGTVTSVSVATANGFAGTVATASTTPAITLTTTVTGLLQGNGTAISGITNSSTVGQVLRVTGASTYAWGALDLADTDAITGTLPVSNGGTGITSFGAGVATFLGTPSAANLRTAVSGTTGTAGNLVFSTSPTLTTPDIGVATATSINGLTITASTGTLTITNGKTVSFSNSITFAGTDSTTMTFPSVSSTIAAVRTCVSIMPKPAGGASGGATNQPFVNDNVTALFGALVVPFQITVNKLSFWLDRTSGSSTFDVALYSEDGQTKVIDITTANISAGTTQVVTTAVSSVVLNPGIYYVGFVPNGTTFSMSFACWNTASLSDAGFDDLLNSVTSEPFLEGSINPVTAGTLPTTINPVTDLTDSGQNLTLAIRLDN